MAALRKGRAVFMRSDESASEVRKIYDARCNAFLDQIEGRNPMNPLTYLNSRVDPLGSLIQNAGIYHTDLLQRDAQCLQLSEELDMAKASIHGLSNDNARLNQEVQQADQKHQVEIINIVTNHQNEINKMDGKFTRTIERRNEEKRKMIEAHETENNRLIRQLFANHGETKQWPDEKLKLKYRELQKLIGDLVVTKELQIQPGQRLPARWDRFDFLTRVPGRSSGHFLLGSLIWKILIDQFFSAPFGFGAFGPGNGKRELTKCYLAWLDLITGTESPRGEDEDYTIFLHEKFANEWRSATFQSIAKVTEVSQSHHLGAIAAENVETARLTILGLLKDVTRGSAGVIPIHIVSTDGDVTKIVKLASDIALQFGIQEGHLVLLAPEHGRRVVIGDRYHHCQDGAKDKGQSRLVDIVTLPGFSKVRDSGTRSELVYVPCELYPDDD